MTYVDIAVVVNELPSNVLTVTFISNCGWNIEVSLPGAVG